VPHNATEKDIRKAYRKKAMKWHPDRHTTKSENEKKLAEKNFKDINEANDALSDPQKRARYDAGEDDLDGPSGGGHGGMHPNDIFAQMFHGGGGGFGGGFGGGGGGHKCSTEVEVVSEEVSEEVVVDFIEVVVFLFNKYDDVR